MKKFKVKFHKEVIVEVPDDADDYQVIEAACDEVTTGDAYITKEDVLSAVQI